MDSDCQYNGVESENAMNSLERSTMPPLFTTYVQYRAPGIDASGGNTYIMCVRACAFMHVVTNLFHIRVGREV